MQPSFALVEGSLIYCHFNPRVASNYEMDVNDFFVRTQPHKKLAEKKNGFTQYTGKVALLHIDKWSVEDATLGWNAENFLPEYRVDIACHSQHKISTLCAYPIDPKMTEKDINGSTIIYPNNTNDGWMFAHSTKEEHLDRMWLASTAMRTLFEGVMDDKLQATLASMINNPATNQQRGVYSHWANILQFKKECTSYCVKFEKLLYLGQHKQETGLNLRDMLLLCVKHVKGEWQKANKYDSVSGDVNSIITALEADHNFETRWEQEARLKAETAARETQEETNE